MKYQTTSYKATQKLGEDFAKKLSGGDILLLYGNLGSGKTTFMQGLAKGLRIKRRIISPTFIIMRSYETSKKDVAMLYHIDLYRTETVHDLEGLGMSDVLSNAHAIVAVEWPEKLDPLFPKKRWELHFETIDENTRSITIDKHE